MLKNIKVIEPHLKPAREVSSLQEDAKRIHEEGEGMVQLMQRHHGLYKRFYAIAHTQVTDLDPLRFFVLNGNDETFKEWKSIVIINPKVVSATKVPVPSEEGCMSFSHLPMKKVMRSNKITVQYQMLMFDDNDTPVLREEVGFLGSFDAWAGRYAERLRAEASIDAERASRMARVNPAYVLRNYLAEQAIRQARQERDYTEIERLRALLQDPFTEQPGMERYAAPPPAWGRELVVSCSS